MGRKSTMDDGRCLNACRLKTMACCIGVRAGSSQQWPARCLEVALPSSYLIALRFAASNWPGTRRIVPVCDLTNASELTCPGQTGVHPPASPLPSAVLYMYASVANTCCVNSLLQLLSTYKCCCVALPRSSPPRKGAVSRLNGEATGLATSLGLQARRSPRLLSPLRGSPMSLSMSPQR